MYPSASNGDTRPITKLDGDTGVVAPTGVALDASGRIYVANDGAAVGNPAQDDVSVYPAGSNANVSPVGSISNLSSPQAIAVAPDGTMYIANGTAGFQQHGTISIIPPSLVGTAKVRMIGATSANDVTELNDPIGLAVDHDGNLYVVGGSDSVAIYGPRADGNIPPTRTISGAKSRLKSPVGIALDAAGKIYVTNDQAGAGYSYSITIYPAGSSGEVAPIAVISGSNTDLQFPQGIAVDTDGKIYVANDGNLKDRAEDATRYDDRPRADPADSITVYAAGSNGNVAPIARINGPRTGLGHPMGIAVGR